MKKKNIRLLVKNFYGTNFIIFFSDKISLLKFIKIYFLDVLVNKKFEKNFFLLFKEHKILIGHNIIPDWPGEYKKNDILENLISWIKLICYNFFIKGKLIAIVLKKK